MHRQPQQEPGVVHAAVQIEADAHALAVVRGQLPLRVVQRVAEDGLDDLLPRRAEVLLIQNGQAQLHALHRLLQFIDEGGQRLALPLAAQRLADQPRDQIHAVVQEVVLPQRRVAAGFDGQRAVDALLVQADGLVDHVAVAALEAVVGAAPFGDELIEAGAGHAVGDEGRAGVLLQQDGGDQRDQAVAVDGLAVLIHDGRAVAVRVEDHAQVGAALQHRPRQRGHGGCVLRVGDVVGEAAVGIQELAALDLRAQLLQEAGVEAARAVARIHDHMQAQQRLQALVVQALAHHSGQGGGVGGEEVHLLDQRIGNLHLRGGLDQLPHAGGVQAALAGDELEAVLLRGMVAGGDHDGAVGPQGFLHADHEHRGRGAQTAVQHVAVRRLHAPDQRLLQARPGGAGIVAHGQLELVGGGAVFARDPACEHVADALGKVVGELFGVAADVGAAAQLQPVR